MNEIGRDPPKEKSDEDEDELTKTDLLTNQVHISQTTQQRVYKSDVKKHTCAQQ